MRKSRLEAFSDGVLAIIITIMVLEIKVPHGTSVNELKDLIPVFSSYILSFLYLGIYWNNHHHIMHTFTHVTGDILWANLHLLFWLSLVPFSTAWIGESYFALFPMAFYGGILLMAAFAYFILQNRIIKSQGEKSFLAKAVGTDLKGKSSPVLYIIGIVSCWISPYLAGVFYIAVALLWLVPDKRIERALKDAEKAEDL